MQINKFDLYQKRVSFRIDTNTTTVYKMSSFESATIVLVGLCNKNPFYQTLLGTIVFRENDQGQKEPQLIDTQLDEEEGLPSNPYKPRFDWKMKGQYGLTFPRVARGHGVTISLNKEKGEYRFMTGINRGDSGSSGPLSNGGSELVDLLDKLFGFVPTPPQAED